MYFVYILRGSQEKWFYVGSTGDLTKRLTAHNTGAVRSTKARRPFICVYTEKFENVQQARRRERELKSNRCKKEDILKEL